MIVKICQFHAHREKGERLVQVFQPGEMEKAAAFFSMGKTAAPLLPAVQAFLTDLKPHPDKIYVLLNALGAGEYWSSNINGDYFPEPALIHRGPDYGYETFYSAYPYKHHVNKDPSKSFGKVLLSVWHNDMKRVELVVEVDRIRAKQFNAMDVVDKLDQGMFPDVSMGCKVPYDLCSICTDWKRYRAAQATYNPAKHRSIGAAVLEVHKQKPITGVSVTRNDYCEHLRKQLNKILPDGRKVYAINDFPKFFDISFVFIGADKTAKVMAKLASAGHEGDVTPSWYLAEQAGYQPETDKELEKAASVGYRPEEVIELVTKQASAGRLVPRSKFAAHSKAGEILKEVVPSQFGGKAVPFDHKDPDLPNEILDRLGKSDLSEALSTPTTMGMLLKPREFQRITIIRLGKKPLADELDRHNLVFPPTDDVDDSVPMGGCHFSEILKKVLLPFLEDRSMLEPVARRKVVRITIIGGQKKDESRDPDFAPNDDFLHKISAAYNGYLDRIIGCYQGTEDAIRRNPDLYEAVHGNVGESFYKTAGESINPKVLFGAVGGAYALSLLADWQRRKALMGRREPVGAMTDFAAEHPKLLMFLAGLGALHQQGSSLPKQLMEGLKGFGKSALTG